MWERKQAEGRKEEELAKPMKFPFLPEHPTPSKEHTVFIILLLIILCSGTGFSPVLVFLKSFLLFSDICHSENLGQPKYLQVRRLVRQPTTAIQWDNRRR